MRIPRVFGGTPVSNVGDGWMKYVHFSGGVYYYHATYRLLTPDDMEDPGCRRAVLRSRNEILNTLIEDGILHCVPSNSELLISDAECGEELSSFLCQGQCKLIEFPERGPGTNVIIQEKTPAYWFYVEQYPMHLGHVPPMAEADFLIALTYGAYEGIMENKNIMFPYTDAQIEQLMTLYRHLKRASMSNRAVVPALIWHIARILYNVESFKLRGKTENKPGFNLQRKPNIVRSTWQLKAADAVLMVLLFGTHRTYLRRLCEARVEDSAYLLEFRESLKQFLEEWSVWNAWLSTAFLSALRPQGIDGVQKTASLASAIFSVLSVLIGVHHVWRHRGKVNTDIIDAVKYVNYARDAETPSNKIDDLAFTAAFLATPIAALLWSVLCFTIAVGAYSIQNTDTTAMLLLATVLGIVGFVGLVTLLFFWHVWKSPESERPPTPRNVPIQAGGVPQWRTVLLEYLKCWRRNSRNCSKD
ncbi:hypothetical protein BKA93DRAFT_728061 [Sparassis latifolia]